MKLAKETEFTEEVRRRIRRRDGEECVFCAMGYHIEDAIGWAPLQVMHVVPRSQMGMGVEQNGALGCVGHHIQMDNGNKGLRPEMIRILEDRMRSFYPGWTRESVTFKKYGGQPEKAAAGSRQDAGPGDGFRVIADGVSGEIPI